MAGAHSVNIVISAHNRASKPIKQVRKDLSRFRTEVVRFNRNLFTASAIIATFAAGFRRAFNLAGVGAQFEFVRQQFLKTFGPQDYLPTLKKAARGTMDSLTMMQLAVKNYARGLSKYETEKIFTLSVGAAKILGTSTANAAKQMSSAFTNLSVKGLQTFLVALNTNNQFSNMNVLIQKLTKGLNAAGRMTENFRRVALAELSKALMQFVDTGDNALQVFMAAKSSFQDLRQVIGSFLGRAMAPLAKQVAMLNFGIFAKLLPILDGATDHMKSLRTGVVALAQSIGGLLTMVGGLVGGWSLLRLLSATLGFNLAPLIGIMGVLGGAFWAAKDKSKGWMETLADIGAEMKFYFQAFASYKDGISTFSRDVAMRIGGMSDKTQERILMIARALVHVKQALMGFFDGVKAVFGLVGAIAAKVGSVITGIGKVFGMHKQFSIETGAVVKTGGKLLGVGAAAGILGGMALGGVNKVARLFGREGFGIKGGKFFDRIFGKRGTSATKPLYVFDVSAAPKGVLGKFFGKGAAAAGGAGSQMSLFGGAAAGGIMGKMAAFMMTSVGAASWTAIAGVVIAGLLAGGIIGILIDHVMSKITGEKSYWMTGDVGPTGSRVSLEGMTPEQRKRMHAGIGQGEVSIAGRKVDTSELTEQTKERFRNLVSQGGMVSTAQLERILSDMKLTNEELLEVNKMMERDLSKEPFQSVNDKPNQWSNFMGPKT